MWYDDARCRGMDPNIFYPDEQFVKDVLKAKEICRQCQVRESCLDYAITHEKWGIWGGLTEPERRKFSADRFLKRRRERLSNASQHSTKHEPEHLVDERQLSLERISDPTKHTPSVSQMEIASRLLSHASLREFSPIQLPEVSTYLTNQMSHYEPSVGVTQNSLQLTSPLLSTNQANLGTENPWTSLAQAVPSFFHSLESKQVQ